MKRWRQYICYRLKSEAGTNAELYRLAVVAEDSQTVGAVAFCANIGNHSHDISCSHSLSIGLRIIDFPSFPAILPMSHSLFNIAQSCGLNALFSEEQMDFISEMMPLNVEARYPSYKDRISEDLSKERCREILDKTKELQQWIKDRL